MHGSHVSWKVLESLFFLKIPGPGKYWKIILVLECPRKISLKITHFFIGSNRNHFFMLASFADYL